MAAVVGRSRYDVADGERERERFVSELRGFLEIKQKSLRFELNYDDE